MWVALKPRGQRAARWFAAGVPGLVEEFDAADRQKVVHRTAIDMPYVGWRLLRDEWLRRALGPRGGIAGKWQQEFDALTMIQQAMAQHERHPAFRARALLGTDRRWFPAWENGATWSPEPVDGQPMRILWPRRERWGVQDMIVTVWQPMAPDTSLGRLADERLHLRLIDPAVEVPLHLLQRGPHLDGTVGE